MTGVFQIYDTGYGYKLVNFEQAETGASSGAITLDLTTSRNFDVTATGAITWTFANAPAGQRLTTTFKLILVDGGVGAQTWPASVSWLSGSTPSLKSSGTNILQFTSTDNGTTWIGSDITPAVIGSTVTTAAFVSGGASLSSFDFNGSTQIIGTGSGAIVSRDGGTTWAVVQGLVKAGSMLYTGASWIVYDSGSGTVKRSTDDGVTWTSVYTPASGFGNIMKAPSGALYARKDSTVYYSTNDGATWTAPATITNVPIGTGLAVSSTIGVTVGANSVTSFVLPTGAGTVRAVTGNPGNLTDAVWNSTLGLFVVVGDAGSIVTSPNGTTWTARASGVSANLIRVKSNGTEYVAVGQSGTILRSPDGINWTSTQVSLTQFNDVDWTGSKWIAVGSGAIIYEFT